MQQSKFTGGKSLEYKKAFMSTTMVGYYIIFSFRLYHLKRKKKKDNYMAHQVPMACRNGLLCFERNTT